MLEILEEKWDQIRSRLSTIWEDLSASDMSKIQTSLQETIHFLKEKYAISESEVINKLEIIASTFEEEEDSDGDGDGDGKEDF